MSPDPIRRKGRKTLAKIYDSLTDPEETADRSRIIGLPTKKEARGIRDELPRRQPLRSNRNAAWVLITRLPCARCAGRMQLASMKPTTCWPLRRQSPETFDCRCRVLTDWWRQLHNNGIAAGVVKAIAQGIAKGI